MAQDDEKTLLEKILKLLEQSGYNRSHMEKQFKENPDMMTKMLTQAKQIIAQSKPLDTDQVVSLAKDNNLRAESTTPKLFSTVPQPPGTIN